MARAFKFEPAADGGVCITYTFPNAMEAIAFVQQINSLGDSEGEVGSAQKTLSHRGAKDLFSPVGAPDAPDVTKDAAIRHALREMKGLASAKVLMAMSRAEKGVASDTYLREALSDGEEPFNLAPAFSNIAKALKKHDLSREDVYDRQPVRSKGKQYFWYRLHPRVSQLIGEIEDFENGVSDSSPSNPFDLL